MKRWLAGGLALLAATVVYGQNFYDLSHTVLPMRAPQYLAHLGDQPLARGPAKKTRWRLAHRLQSGWEYDNNIYESSVRRTASGSPRFLLSTRGDCHNERWQIHYDYAAVLQTYTHHGDENKLSHDLGAQAGVRLWPWLRLSSRVNGTLKFYLENVADYGTTSGSLIAGVILPYKLRADLSAETGQLDYMKSDFYDFTFRGAELTLRRAMWANSSLETTLNRRVAHYERRARGQLLELKDELQRDEITTWRVGMTYGRKLVTQVAVEAQINRSNSFGYDYNRFRASGLLGFRPVKNWLLRAAGTLQRKRYRDDLARLNILDLDTEREQSNFLVVDISRDFSEEISLLARVAVYNNESTVPGVFYHKILYFTGLEIRL
jgi:hypothetical protein